MKSFTSGFAPGRGLCEGMRVYGGSGLLVIRSFGHNGREENEKLQ